MHKSNKNTSNFKAILSLIKFFPSHLKLKFFPIIFLIFVSGLAEILNVLTIGPFISVLVTESTSYKNFPLANFIDFVSSISEISSLAIVIILFAISIIFSTAARIFLLVKQTKYAYNIGEWLNFYVYEQVIFQPFDFHSKKSSNDLVSLLTTKISRSVNDIIFPSLNLISSLVTIILIIITLLAYKPIATIGTFFTFGFVYIALISVVKVYLSKASFRINMNTKIMHKNINESLGCIREVLLGHFEKFFLEKARLANSDLRSSEADVQIISALPRHIIEGFSLIILSCLAFYCIYTSENLPGAVTIIGVLIFTIQRLLPLFQSIYAGFAMILANNDNIVEILNVLSLKRREEFISINRNDKISFKNEIKIENLTFSYSPERFIFKNLNLKILKGSKIGIIGKSGCGKSSLLDLIAGLLCPTDGSIFIDSVRLNESNIPLWKNKVSFVPQHITLLNASILENVALGVNLDQIDISLAYKALDQAQLLDFVNLLPKKHLTVIGDGGDMNLSGGERQRIGIARALYKRAEVIIMDEATSALDKTTEANFVKMIANLNKNITLIFVTHRNMLLSNFDEVYQLTSYGLKNNMNFKH